MTRKKRINSLLLAFAGILFGLSLLGCEREEPTVAKIRVVDISGNPVSNAFVRLYGTSTNTPPRPQILDDTLYTDMEGFATIDYSERFNLGQAGVFVLDIDARREALVGNGIIKIEAESTNETTVIIN